MSERFRHEDIASVPAGWKVRTVTTSGGHRVRVAFPPGRRVTGAGRLVSILHPLSGSNPCGNPCSLRSSNPQELMVMGANPPRRRKNPPELSADEKHGLTQLWHTARIAGYNKFGERITWAAKQWDRSHPGQRMRAYKWLSSEMRGYGEGGSGRGMNPHHEAMPSNPYYSEKIDLGKDRAVIWAGTEAGPFHVNLYSENVSLGEKGRGYSTLKRARNVAQKALDELRARERHNPHELLIMGANPRVEVVHGENPPVEDIHEEFTGQEVKWIDVYNEPHMPAGRYAELGPLIALYVKPVKGGQVLRIGAPENHEDFADWWDKKPPIIVTDSTARQIYFVDGCQDVSNMLEQFGAVEQGYHATYPRNHLWMLGQVRRIDYECRKEHVAHPDEDRWKHDHGEEDGQFPALLFDARHKRMVYAGGNYRIEGPWIKN